MSVLRIISVCPNQPDLPSQLKTHIAFSMCPITTPMPPIERIANNPAKIIMVNFKHFFPIFNMDLCSLSLLEGLDFILESDASELEGVISAPAGSSGSGLIVDACLYLVLILQGISF